MHRPIDDLKLIIMTAAAIASFLAPAFAAPREVSISVVDGSQAGCPITLSGNIRFSDEASATLRYSFRTALIARNVSTKSILALVIEINTTGTGKIDLHNTRKEDYFFRDEIFGVNATVRLDEVAGPFGEPQAKIEQEPEPKSVAAVMFVQFADGSTWGDPAEGRNILLERNASITGLRFLADIYETKGEEQFVAALKQPSSLDAVTYLQQLYAKNRDAASVRKHLAAMMQCADRHQRALQHQEKISGFVGAGPRIDFLGS